MKISVLEILSCPRCGSALKLRIMEQENDDIRTGILSCEGCSSRYDIEDFIPRLFTGNCRV